MLTLFIHSLTTNGLVYNFEFISGSLPSNVYLISAPEVVQDSTTEILSLKYLGVGVASGLDTLTVYVKVPILLFSKPVLKAIAFKTVFLVTAIGLTYIVDAPSGVLPSNVYLIVALGVKHSSLTYVPYVKLLEFGCAMGVSTFNL